MSSHDERDPRETGAQTSPHWSIYSLRVDTVWQRSRQFTPPTDVIELADRLIVRVEIAGVSPDGFTIHLDHRHLMISGQRARPHLGSAAYHRVEIGYGEFRVDVTVPFNVRGDDIAAVYQEGILQIDLPRQPESRIHIIDVGGSADDAEQQQTPSASSSAAEATQEERGA